MIYSEWNLVVYCSTVWLVFINPTCMFNEHKFSLLKFNNRSCIEWVFQYTFGSSFFKYTSLSYAVTSWKPLTLLLVFLHL